jgi:hypothetical protein
MSSRVAGDDEPPTRAAQRRLMNIALRGVPSFTQFPNSNENFDWGSRISSTRRGSPSGLARCVVGERQRKKYDREASSKISGAFGRRFHFCASGSRPLRRVSTTVCFLIRYQTFSQNGRTDLHAPFRSFLGPAQRPQVVVGHSPSAYGKVVVSGRLTGAGPRDVSLGSDLTPSALPPSDAHH